MVCKCFHVEQTLSNRGVFTLVEKYTRKSNGKLRSMISVVLRIGNYCNHLPFTVRELDVFFVQPFSSPALVQQESIPGKLMTHIEESEMVIKCLCP